MGHANDIYANVIDVKTSGDDGAYRFAVTLKSTETGCAQYTDWWEVLSEKGELLYRRILCALPSRYTTFYTFGWSSEY